MPSSTLATRNAPSRPVSWQQGDRVKLRDDVCHHAKYRAAKGLIGVIELANEADPFSPLGPIANVVFTHPDLPKPIRVTDIPYNYLCTAHPFAGDTILSEAKPKHRSPLNLHNPVDTRSERQKQDEGQAWLVARGYRVLVAGQYVRKVMCDCGCGNWFWPKGFGNTVGMPDTCVFHPVRWTARGARVPVLFQEWKRDEKADRKPEQEALAQSGASVFVWSLSTMLSDLVAFERELGYEPHPDALGYLERHAPKETTMSIRSDKPVSAQQESK